MQRRWRVQFTMRLHFTLFRVFSGKNAQGNVAAVALVDQLPNIDEHLHYSHAVETCVYLQTISETHYKIRWFNSEKAIQRCGHGSLAAAAFLNTLDKREKYIFETDTETITIRCDCTNRFVMNLPTETLNWVALPSDDRLNCVRLAKSSSSQGYLIAELSNEEAVQEFVFSDSLLPLLQERALIITAQHGRLNHNIVFRYFAPQHGVLEDMATGSAASALWPYWNDRFKPQTSSLNCYQISPAGGYFQLKVDRTEVSVIGGVEKLLPTPVIPSSAH